MKYETQEFIVRKSINDKKDYRHISLENGIRVLLISNKEDVKQAELLQNSNAEEMSAEEEVSSSGSESEPEVIKQEEPNEVPKVSLHDKSLKEKLMKTPGIAGFALYINSGAANEDQEIHGIAHLLEHALFLGCKDFPGENDFSLYISQNGGCHNAETTFEHTLFEFSIVNEKLGEGIHRLSRMLKDPLFREESIEKELKAIQNEFDLSFTNIEARRFQIMIDSTLDNCRYKRFSWGNMDSLSQPIATLKEKLVKYFNEFYVPERMSICVYSRLELDELESLVKENFKDYTAAGPEYRKTGYKYEENDNLSLQDYAKSYQGLYFIESPKEDNYLVLTWLFPPSPENYKSKPLQIICDIIEEEGPNSLHKYLKENGLINSLSAAYSEEDFSRFLVPLNIYIDLTKKGIEFWECVVNECFKYIQMIKEHGIPLWYYKENETMSWLRFNYSESEGYLGLATAIVGLLKICPPEDLLYVYKSIYLEINEGLVKKYLDMLIVDDLRIDLITVKENLKYKGVEIAPLDHNEKWFKTLFTKKMLEGFFPIVENWELIPSDYKIPIKNPFIPESFDICEEPSNLPKEPLELKFDQDGLEKIKLWWYMDKKDEKPKVSVSIILIYSAVSEEIFDQTCMEIFVGYFEDLFDEEIGYQSYAADVEFRVNQNENAFIEFSILSFSDKLQYFLERLFKLLIHSFKCLKENLYNQVVERFMKVLQNDIIKDPEAQIDTYLDTFVIPGLTLPEETLNILGKDVNFKTFSKFCEEKLGNWECLRKIGCYFHGNITQNVCEDYIKQINSLFKNGMSNKTPVNAGLDTSQDIFCVKMLNLPCKEKSFDKKFVFYANNKENRNNIFCLYMELPPENSYYQRVQFELFESIFKSIMFEELRTNQQLGYVVSSNMSLVRGKLLLKIYITSSTHTTAQVKESVLNFIKWFVEEYLTKLKKHEFDSNVHGLISARKEFYKNINFNSSTNWGEIFHGTFSFDRREKEIAFLQTYSLLNLVDWAKTFILGNEKYITFELINEEEASVPYYQSQMFNLHDMIMDNRKQFYEFFDYSLYSYSHFN